MRSSKPYIAIEGNIASGKTTVLELLRRTQPSLCCIEEPVFAFQKFLHYDPLKLSYEDPVANAAVAQHHIITQSCEHYEKSLLPLHFKYECAISERSVLSPMAFIQTALMNKTFSPFVSDYLLVELVKKSRDIRKPDIIVYLDLSAEECYDRVLKRARASEVRGCTLSFLQRLECCYKEILNNHSDASSTPVFWFNLVREDSPKMVARRVLGVIRDVSFYGGEKNFAEVTDLHTIE